MIQKTEAQRIQPFLGPGGWYLYTPILSETYNRLTGGDRERISIALEERWQEAISSSLSSLPLLPF
jgi:hypothetical protein